MSGDLTSHRGGGLRGLAPGLSDPIRDSQACFRAVLEAMAHPGRIVTLPRALAAVPPAPLGEAAAMIALSLCDLDAPVWLDQALKPCIDYLKFHCGCPIVNAPAQAQFAFVGNPERLPPLDSFALGSDEYPDRSTTVTIAVAALDARAEVALSGPGIRGTAALAAAGMPDRFWRERQLLAELLPRGIDVLLVSGRRVAALPRSARVTR